MRSVRRWSDSDEPHASATDHLGTRASGPYVKAARRLGLRLVPGYAGLRPACGSGAPSGASAAACCHLGTRASGPHVRFTEGKPLSTPSTRHLARASHLPNFHLPRPFRSGRERGNEDGSALMTWASCHMIIEMRDQNPSVGVSAHY